MATPVFAVDTNCMIAVVCSWHAHHDAVHREVERRLGRGERMAVAAVSLVEAYAVLTRLPAPHRLSPADAWTALSSNFTRHVRLVTLPARAYLDLLAELVRQSVSGGRAYDMVIARCARLAGAGSLLTLNRRDFEQSSGGIQIVDPSDAA